MGAPEASTLHPGRTMVDVETYETDAERDPTAALLASLATKGRDVAGRYRIEALLGAGSAGIVVLARHVYLQRPVTLKILRAATPAGEEAQRRLTPIRHAAAGLRSRHVARTLDAGLGDDGAPFIVSERLDGHSLADELQARTKVPVEEAVDWVLQACEALAEAHAGGIVHGDLKPRNLFLARASADSEERTLKVLDFGMVSPLEDVAGDHSTTWFASPAYLSPEQIHDPVNIDARTDVWALGVILYELIEGSLPFSAENVAGVLVAVTSDEPAPLSSPDVAEELGRVILACLARDPAARPASVASLARELAPFAGSAGPSLAASVDAAAARGAALATSERPALDLADPAPPAEVELSPLARVRAHMRRGRRWAGDDLARRQSRRALLLAAATMLAAAAVAAMPSRRTQRAQRDLADPPEVDGSPPPSSPPPRSVPPVVVAAAPPPPPIVTAPSSPAIVAVAPRPLAEASIPKRPRPRATLGFTHPTELDHPR